jgi:competence protein ComEA
MPNFNFEVFFQKYRLVIFLLLGGIILVFVGLFITKSNNFSQNKIEILNDDSNQNGGEIIVEIAGSVINPGVYKLSNGSRVEDLLVASGGINSTADRNWMEKTLNRAAKLTDGQKIYIPSLGKQTEVLSAKNSVDDKTISSNFSGQGSGLININSATAKELDSLPGIGPVYAQNIIEHRPYSSGEELVSKKVIPSSTFEKIKNLITTY